MKRIMAMALVALVAVALFAGCGKKEDKKVDLNAVMETINSENNFNLPNRKISRYSHFCRIPRIIAPLLRGPLPNLY